MKHNSFLYTQFLSHETKKLVNQTSCSLRPRKTPYFPTHAAAALINQLLFLRWRARQTNNTEVIPGLVITEPWHHWFPFIKPTQKNKPPRETSAKNKPQNPTWDMKRRSTSHCLHLFFSGDVWNISKRVLSRCHGVTWNFPLLLLTHKAHRGYVRAEWY